MPHPASQTRAVDPAWRSTAAAISSKYGVWEDASSMNRMTSGVQLLMRMRGLSLDDTGLSGTPSAVAPGDACNATARGRARPYPLGGGGRGGVPRVAEYPVRGMRPPASSR